MDRKLGITIYFLTGKYIVNWELHESFINGSKIVEVSFMK